MHLRIITLRQFRNHRDLELNLDSGLNLFIGPNGSGKTNIIEAVAVLATGVSPRGAEPETLVQWGEKGFYVRGEFVPEPEGRDPLALEMKYQVGGARVIRENGTTAVRLKDLIGRAPLVSFVPEDLALVKGEPDVRRRALNMVLAQADPLYAEGLRRYNEALKSRNAALKQLAEGVLTGAALDPWDVALVREGLPLCRKRADFVADFSVRLSRIHECISGNAESVRLDYKPSFTGPWEDAEADRWLQRLQGLRADETAAGTTLIGPHRDDLVFLLDGRAARFYASEGQKRTAAVSFKLAEVQYIEEKLGQKPICLLDDVLSELDANRAEQLLDQLARAGQCFVTLTGLESWPRKLGLPAAVFEVNKEGVNRSEGFFGKGPLSKEAIFN